MNVPQEILIEILSRVSAKSIGQFRCVSKLWHSLLYRPQLIKAHLFHHHHHQENLLLLSTSQSLYRCLPCRNLNDIVPTRLVIEDVPQNWEDIVGSCHGLVLAVHEDKGTVLINPTTLELKLIERSPLALDARASFCMYGFGYDSSSDDYKLVVLSYYKTDNEYEQDIADTFVDVCSLKVGTWRRLESSPYDHVVAHLSSGVLINGFLQWLAWGSSSVIAAFDLAEEKFRVVPASSCLDKNKFVFNRLVTLGGRLCMVAEQGYDQIDIWMMKEYGVEESWTKLTIKGPEFGNTLKPLYLNREEEVVLDVDEEKLIVFNLKEGTWRDMAVDGIPALFKYGTTFVESLISLDFSNQIEGQCIA